MRLRLFIEYQSVLDQSLGVRRLIAQIPLPVLFGFVEISRLFGPFGPLLEQARAALNLDAVQSMNAGAE